MIDPAVFISSWVVSPFASVRTAPWSITHNAEDLIRRCLGLLPGGYSVDEEIAVHASARIETGVMLKGPIVIGPDCLVAAGAYLRGGCYLAEKCTIGPGSELKTSFMFEGAKIAHLNFVGDSLIGADVNIEAGAVIANYRNELDDREIRIRFDGSEIATGVEKFGALIGDGSRIGANAVIAPGAILKPHSRVGRLQLLDQYPHA